MTKTHTKNLLTALIGAAVLSACGGGGGATDGTSATTANLTGKAIDGYLVGGTVCLDLNNNNLCDSGEPSAVTDANGNYGLVFAGDPTGKKLLVVATPTTQDKSRPGYTFPAGFTLSAVADGSAGQNVTPLTTMVLALMDSGQTQAAAERAVTSLVGGTVDLKADYIASGDSSTATFAAKVVDKVVEFAGNASNADTVRAVMNAIVSKGNVDLVSQTDVDAAAKMPTYQADINVADLLNKPLYSYDLTQHPELSTVVPDHPELSHSDAELSGVHWSLTNTALQDDVTVLVQSGQAMPWMGAVDTWERERYDGLHSMLASVDSQLVLQSDGTWAPFSWRNSDNSYKRIQVQGFSGNVLTIANPKTGAPEKIEYRSLQLGEISFADATLGLMDDYTRTRLSGAFTGDVPAYLGILTTGADVISVDAGTGCENTSNSCIDASAQVHASVDDVIGLRIPAPSWMVGLSAYVPNTKLVLSADGTGQLVDDGNSQVVYGSTRVTWSKYGGNQNVIVVSIALDSNSNYELRNQDFLRAGGKLVVALQDGHLKLGQLLPAGTEFRFMEYSQTALNQLVVAIRQALSL